MRIEPELLTWLVLLLVAWLGVALIWRLYRMAMDPVTRVRDTQGREIRADELGSDEPEELRSDRREGPN